jgi:hypothetical protein
MTTTEGTHPYTMISNEEGLDLPEKVDTKMGEVRQKDIRGNQYLIRGGSTLEQDTAEYMFDNIYAESMNMSSKARKKSRIYKYLNLFSNMIGTFGGLVVCVMGLFGANILTFESVPLFGTIAAIGCVIAIVGIIEWVVGLRKRSLRIKDTYRRLRTIVSDVRHVHESSVSAVDKIVEYEKYFAELDSIDLNIFGNQLETGGKKGKTNKRISYDAYGTYGTDLV